MNLGTRWFTFLGGIGVALGTCEAMDWPRWRGPDFNGISRESLPESFPAQLPIVWKRNLGTGFSTVSVSEGRVYSMGNRDEQDTVWCLDEKTGEVIWKYSYPCPLDPLYYEGGPSATPTVDRGSLYTLSKKGHVIRFDAATGELVWKRDLVGEEEVQLPEWSFASSPFVDGDRILLNVGRQGMALDRETGKTLWKPSVDTSGYATVVPFPGAGREDLHLLFSAEALLAFQAATGKTIWEFPSRSSRDVNAADPIVRGNRILHSSSSGTVLLEVDETGRAPREIWRQRDLKWYFNAGVLVGNHVYSLHGTTHRPTELTCTDFETGETVWSEPGFGSGGLMAAGETIVLFDQGTLTLFPASPDGFEPILQQPILEGKCWTVPVLSNGRIYCRNADGDLACVKLP